MTGLPEETKSGVAIEQSVMAGHSRPKDGVASLAYARRSIMEALCLPKRDRRDKPGDDSRMRLDLSEYTHIYPTMRPEELLTPTPSGVCCQTGGFHIDPTRPVDKA